MYRGQETHPIRVNARYAMNWAYTFFKKFRKPCLQTDWRTDTRTDRHRGESSIPPFHLRWSGGIIKRWQGFLCKHVFACVIEAEMGMKLICFVLTHENRGHDVHIKPYQWKVNDYIWWLMISNIHYITCSASPESNCAAIKIMSHTRNRQVRLQTLRYQQLLCHLVCHIEILHWWFI